MLTQFFFSMYLFYVNTVNYLIYFFTETYIFFRFALLGLSLLRLVFVFAFELPNFFH